MSGMLWQRRVQNPQHFRPGLEPSGKVEALALRLPQPQLHGAQSAQREKDIFRPRTHGEGVVGLPQSPRPCGIRGDEPEQQV